MNRIFYLIFIISSLFISSCNVNTKKTNKSVLIIEDFNLQHYSKNGSKLYMLETPYSVLNQTDQSYLLNKTNIKFFDQENVKYNVNSDSAKLLNNKFLELKGNVEINDFNNNKTIIKSNNLFWDIDKSEFILEGEVSLVNNIINLSSSKALFDKKDDTILFYNPIKYNYIDEEGIRKYNISSENAYYNISTKNVIFKSKDDKVKSKLIF
tara:strand:- start:1065 stop:1691 length:627 start_codon:yes stop_codon:yes gene_type:complete